MRNLVRRLVPRALRNWLRAPAKSLARLREEARFRLSGPSEIELRPGWRVRCHPTAARVYALAQQNDPVQAAELDEFIAHCRPGMILYDLGAHFGVFSVAAIHYGGAAARAIAVDPSPTAAKMIETQARLNDLADRLDIVRAAIGAAVGEQRMVSVGVLADGYMVGAEADRPERDTTRVAIVSLDHLVERSGLAPTHVKIDVEGFEGDALRGGRTVLRAHRPLLFVELHHAMVRADGRDPGATLEELATLGYRTFSENGRIVRPEELLERPLVRIVARA